MTDEEWLLLYVIDLYEGMDTRGRKYYEKHQPNWSFGSGTTPADVLYDKEKVETFQELRDDAYDEWERIREERFNDEN